MKGSSQSIAQGGIGLLKPQPAANGHVDRYVTISIPGQNTYGYGKLTIDEAKQLRKDLAEAIKTAGE